jgi:glycerophosphoryl diester phosphodiesterase
MKSLMTRLLGVGLLALTALNAGAALAGDRHHEEDRGHDRRRADMISVGVRPYYLVSQLDNGPLKRKLQSCEDKPVRRSPFTIGHRGAAMQFPEHTRESYEAAARQGAGIVECDVTFTKDRELVCRHSQCDLATTTNILAIPELAAKCSQPFIPADPATGTPAQARCCTTDITLAEFRQLKGKMDGANPMATTPEEYMAGTPNWRTDLYTATGTLMTHKESIALFKKLGVQMTPELKGASVAMPYEGDYTQEAYAQQMIDEYKEMGVSPRQVWPQSFNLDDVLYWIAHEPRFGRQAVYLDDADTEADVPASIAQLPALAAQGVNVVAPPLWMLVTVDGNDRIVPSEYAKAAKAAGLEIITWTLERSGTLTDGGGWYYQSITRATHEPADTYRLLDVLAQDVGILGIFSDWPATVAYYASCMGK